MLSRGKNEDLKIFYSYNFLNNIINIFKSLLNRKKNLNITITHVRIIIFTIKLYTFINVIFITLLHIDK